jgi:nickel-dependent lactate racemase
MKVDITYGKEQIKINIGEQVTTILPNRVLIKNEDKLIEQALEKPIAFESYDGFAEKINKLLLIINDATKPTPTSKILKYLLPVLSSHPDVKFLVATGAHRAPSEEELKFILGETYEIFRRKTYIHDAKKQEKMTYLGKTKNGTEIRINKLVEEYKNILVIGSVEPHYFAGCTGGRKAFIPGVASYKTIEMNHKYALSDKASSLVLEDNPIHEDMTDGMKFLERFNIFSIQTVLDFDHNIYAVTAGDLIKSFDAAIKYVKDVYCVPIKEKGNIVITVVKNPMDINLYQSQHALENGKLALDEGGVMILISKCHTGVGNDNFLKLLSKADTPDEVMNLIGGEYKLGSHKAIRILKIKSKAKIFAVTDLDDQIIEKSKMKPYKNIQKALDDAIEFIKTKGKKPKVIIIPDGSHTVPMVEEKQNN